MSYENSNKTAPYYGRDRRTGRERRLTRPGDRRRSHMILPPPSVIEQYDKLVPGSGEQLLDMAEAELEHRHDWEAAYLKSYAKSYHLGQISGILFVMIIVSVALYLAITGMHDIAVILVVSSFASLAFASLATSKNHHFHSRPWRPHNKRPFTNRGRQQYSDQDENEENYNSSSGDQEKEEVKESHK